MFLETNCDGVSRRGFLKVGSAGLCGLTLPSILRLESQAKAAGAARSAGGKASSVIMIWLAGGPATIDMWDLKPNAPEGIRGEFKPVNTSADGIQISEHLPEVAKIMNKATLVRSLHHPIPSHAPGTVFMTTGNKPTPALQYPSMGSLVTRLMPAAQGVPPYVSFSELRNGLAGGAGYLGTGYNPFIVEGAGGGRGNGNNKEGGTTASLRVRGITLPTGFTLDQLENRDRLIQDFDRGLDAIDRNADLAEGLDTFHRQALEILRSDKTKGAFNLSQESARTLQKYGTTPFGQGALAARRLIQAGVRFTTVSSGVGWDTHSQNFNNLKTRNLPVLDQVLSALVEDLDQQGMLESTIVYVAGEFGRTPRINGNAGRDHWSRSMSVFLAGGGFKKGYVHGSTDAQGMAPATDACSPDDVSATIFQQLGIDPKSELQTSTGRPITLFREGSPIARLVG